MKFTIVTLLSLTNLHMLKQSLKYDAFIHHSHLLQGMVAGSEPLSGI